MAPSTADDFTVERSNVPILIENPSGDTLPEGPIKEKRRQRFIRGIQRISSSPSLAQIGRARSSSAPYGTKGSLSCVSLAATPSFAPYNPRSVTPGYFSNSPSSGSESPTIESPAFECIEPLLAPRKVVNASTTCLATTSPLPAEVAATRSRSATTLKRPSDFWGSMPDEIRLHIFSFLHPRELVRTSRVSKTFHQFCFDGQLWTHFDATDFYSEIPADSLAKIVVAAGPFIKNLNIRGCLQIEHYQQAEAVVNACRNLINATLEGCRNFRRQTLHNLIRANSRLTNINLTGMTAVTNSTCKIISQHCPQLETINVSWCKHMDARGIKMMVVGCPKLRDLRAGEIKGFEQLDVAQAIFRTNRLERLVLNGCAELTDDALKTMVHGVRPEMDILTDRPIVPERKLRHLDLSRCSRLTNDGVKAMGYLVPRLEGLRLSGCSALTDSALEPILASTPRLTHLELEDVPELTNDLLSEHLAKAACAARLEHLALSYCEKLGDAGVLPVIRNCASLKSIDLDNTRIGDLVLTEAAAMVRSRAARSPVQTTRPRVGLRLVVYDCQLVTWTGVREVLSRNAEVGTPSRTTRSYPTEIIGMKCYYGWQQTVEQHTKRVLMGDFAAAARLERKWADYMQAVEEAGVAGAGHRRRRRRAREAQILHADEEEGGAAAAGRRRARTMAASCAVM